MSNMIFQRYWLIFLAILSAGAFVGLSYATLSLEQLEAYSEENKLIEILTAIFLLAGAGFGIYTALKTSVKGWYVYAFLALMGAGREMDAHKMWTEMSILKSRFYLSPEIPFAEKLFGILVIATLVFAAYKTARKFIPSLSQLWYGVNHVVAIYICLGYFTIAKILDSFFRLFPAFKEHREEYGMYMRYAEESMEMAGAFFLMLAPLFFIKLYKSQKA